VPLRVASYLFPLWVALGLVIPEVLGGVISLSWGGVWTGLIWGRLVRIFLVHHVTWSVNSSCHLPTNAAFLSRSSSIVLRSDCP
jgi:stearoyl-CoA desaturase (delta-9 desaturase)